jgi:hypothetical protein
VAVKTGGRGLWKFSRQGDVRSILPNFSAVFKKEGEDLEEAKGDPKKFLIERYLR